MEDLFSPRGLSGRTLTRSDLAPLAGGPPQDVVDCDLEDVDLSGLDLTGWRFEGSDLRGADLGGRRLVDAGLFRGATISREQAGQLLGELGLNVR